MRQSEATITENFNVILKNVENNVKRTLRVGTLARVVKVDKFLTVQPVIMEKVNTKTGYKYLKLPQIKNVPYISGQTPRVGDYVVCLHLDRSKGDLDFDDKERFIESGTNRHDLNDCVAIVIQSGNEWTSVFSITTVDSFDLSSYSQLKILFYVGNSILNCTNINVSDLGEQNSLHIYSKYNEEEYSVDITNSGVTNITTGARVVIYAR